MSVQPMGEQIVSSMKFTWKISNLTEKCYSSEIFTIGGKCWQILVYPKGNTDYLSLFLIVANSADLPPGWTRLAEFSFAVINQTTTYSSVKMEASHNFRARATSCGFAMVVLSELRDGGLLVNDTLIIEACFHVPETAMEDRPTLITSKEMLDSQLSCLEQFMDRIKDPMPYKVRSVIDSLIPTLDEVEHAKSSLKECLSDLCKLNITDSLKVAVSTLSRAQDGLSARQLSAIRTFWDSFENCMLDFLTFSEANAAFELQKLASDQMLFDMRKGLHKVKKLLKEIVKDYCKGSREEMRMRKEKLELDLEVLFVESEESETKYAEQEKKLKDAEEKKRIALEMMSRSALAWSNLKTEFA